MKRSTYKRSNAEQRLSKETWLTLFASSLQNRASRTQR